MTWAELRALSSRLASRGVRDGRCFVWVGARVPAGYGKMSIGGRLESVPRLALVLKLGRPLQPGEQALHHCDNPPCFRRSHLFVGTNADNRADMLAKGRGPAGDRNGSRRHPERLPRGDGHPARRHPDTVVRGERHPNARLNERVVRLMRRERAGGVEFREIAERHGVSTMTAFRATTGRSWTHVR